MNDHVLITGGSRGIGAATVLEFARAGYDVAFTWNSREDAALDVVQQAQALNPGGRFVALHADVSDSAQVNAAVQEALQQFGSLQALMCCAGIAQQKLFTDLTDEDWHRMMGVDLDGVFYACRAVLPGMIRQKYGRILLASSLLDRCVPPVSAGAAGHDPPQGRTHPDREQHVGPDRRQLRSTLFRRKGRCDRPDQGARQRGRSFRHYGELRGSRCD